MEHSPGLPQDTKSLRRCISRVILGSKVPPNNARSTDSFSTVLARAVNGGWLGMHCPWLGDYHSLGMISIEFNSPNITPLTNPAKVADQGLCYYNSNAWLWHHSHQSGVISITDLHIFQNRKKRRSVQGEQSRVQNINVNQFTLTTIHHNMLWSVWKKLCQYRQHRTSNAHRAGFTENAWWLTLYQRLHWNPPARCKPPLLSLMHFAVDGTTTKVHHRYTSLSDKQTGWLEAQILTINCNKKYLIIIFYAYLYSSLLHFLF